MVKSSESLLTKNFREYEFDCKCSRPCDNNGFTIDRQLVKILQEVRNHFKLPVIINSGIRCHTHNKQVGGAPNSQHLFGKAADIRIDGVLPSEIYEYLNAKMVSGGLKQYPTWVHVDVRSVKWRG